MSASVTHSPYAPIVSIFQTTGTPTDQPSASTSLLTGLSQQFERTGATAQPTAISNPPQGLVEPHPCSNTAPISVTQGSWEGCKQRSHSTLMSPGFLLISPLPAHAMEKTSGQLPCTAQGTAAMAASSAREAPAAMPGTFAAAPHQCTQMPQAARRGPQSLTFGTKVANDGETREA